MKISEISTNDLSDYLRLVHSDMDGVELSVLDTILAAARAYIKSYTGLTDEEADECEDLPIALYVLAQDMYDNRTYYVDGGSVNRTVETILGMHSRNLL